VRTQNNLCKIIPLKNNINNVNKKLNLKKYDIKNAAIIVNNTSAIAILNILYE
jgi:hypothetical protein